MPRKNFPVWELISKNPMLIKGEIHEWSDGGELEDVLLQIVQTVCCVHSTELLADCKFQNMAAAAVAVAAQFPQPVSVPR
ncbi:Inorganic pyrophosphatase 2 [Linum perenne]